MKIALVYDWVVKIGGAERILVALHEIWPEAPLYTAVYNPQTAPWARDFKVIPSFLQKFPLAKTNHELYPWLAPLAFESFNFNEYDIVVSVTTEAAKGIITKPKTLHICYCLTPTRYLWSHYDLYFRGEFFRWLTTPVVAYLRKWDKIAGQRPDYYFALSENVKERIKRYYERGTEEIIYPPVDTEKFNFQAAGPAKSGQPATPRSTATPTPYTLHSTLFFLIVSRLVPYKRIELAIEAFNELGLPLKIVGTGSQMGRLKGLAKPNVEFLGELTEEALLRYYQECQALIFPQEEDLGLTPIETQACGRPVIAFKGGGALETVTPGKTGEFFYPQTAEALKRAVGQFKSSRYKPADCRKNAERFAKEIFQKNFKNTVERLFSQYDVSRSAKSSPLPLPVR